MRSHPGCRANDPARYSKKSQADDKISNFFDKIMYVIFCDTCCSILFNEDMAHAIMRFVDDGKFPLLVHCTAGISRSGAVGEVLNWYFNRYLENNTADDEDFEQNNRQIQPNALVRIIMLKVLAE